METIVGSGQYTYKVREDWAHVPIGVDMKPAAVAVDPHDRVYCFNRSPDHPVVVFDRSGEFLFSWGAGRADSRTPSGSTQRVLRGSPTSTICSS